MIADKIIRLNNNNLRKGRVYFGSQFERSPAIVGKAHHSLLATLHMKSGAETSSFLLCNLDPRQKSMVPPTFRLGGPPTSVSLI